MRIVSLSLYVGLSVSLSLTLSMPVCMTIIMYDTVCVWVCVCVSVWPRIAVVVVHCLVSVEPIEEEYAFKGFVIG